MRIPLLLIVIIGVAVLVLSLALFPKPEQMGQALEKGGRLDEALAYYQSALDANPLDEPTWVRVASTYQLRGQPEDAIAVYQRLTQLDPNDVGYRRALALFDEWSLLMDDSAAQKARVAELEPKDIAVRQELAQYYVLEHKDYATAAKFVEQIVASRPQDAEMLVDLARLYIATGRIQDAIGAYQRALEADEGNPNISRALARATAWNRQRELQPEILELRRAFEENPNDRTRAANLIEILRRASQTVEAEEIEQRLGLTPSPSTGADPGGAAD